MKQTFSLGCLAGAAALVLSAAPALAADKVDVSLETSPNHVRNISMERWAKQLNEQSGGDLKIVIFHGASKYKGTNVPTALGQGALDMGAPAWVHTSKFLPDHNMPSLPMFYGASRKVVHTIFDGEVGKALNAQFEKKFKVKVIGPWFDLGFGEMFFTKTEVKSHADLKGLRMRIPGGAANLARFRIFGSTPQKIAWPDVPQALTRNLVDGLLTTHESVRSAKLWDSGLKYAYDDNQMFFQYIPTISKRKWDSLKPANRKLIVDSWAKMIPETRKFAEERQNSARADGAKMGIKRIDGNPADLKKMRQLLLKEQAAIVKQLKMDPKLVAKTQKLVDKLYH